MTSVVNLVKSTIHATAKNDTCLVFAQGGYTRIMLCNVDEDMDTDTSISTHNHSNLFVTFL